MLKRVLDYCSNTQRLNIATAGAILTHLFLFGGGFLVIDQFLIPSDTNRVLVLSLKMETEDGEKEADLAEANTINSSKLGEASSIVDQAPPTEMAAAPSYQQLSAHTSSQIESKIEPKPEQPSPRNSATQEFSELSTPPSKHQSTSDKTQSLPAEETNVAFNSAAITPAEPILSTSESSLTIATTVASAQSTDLGERLELSNTQQKMLNRKIRHWTENMEDFSDSSEPISWRHKGQTYIASFNRLPAAGDMDMDEVVVEIITEQHGKELRKELRMKKLAFSNFAQFTHLWDDNVTIHDDILDGRFHSNSTIYLSSDRHAKPIFNGKVTTASYQVDIDAIGSRGSKKNIFLGGLQTRVKKIRMPKPNLLFDEKLNDLLDNKIDNLLDNTLVLNEDTQIHFNHDGSVSWQAMNNSAAHDSDTADQVEPRIQSKSIGDEPFYILAGSSVKLSASGTVNGKVLLYSPKRVTIEGNLVYANRGDIASGGDFLGIVSGRNVVIAASSITGPGDLRIDASIYAKGLFKVKNYRSAQSATLHLFGSVSAMSLGATEPRYATNIVFDQRLENTRPPGFPVTNRYELAAVDQDWKKDGWVETKSPETSVEPKPSLNQH